MLHLQYMIISEHQRQGARGTFDLLGVFDRVTVDQLPAQHRQLVLTVQIVTNTEDGLGKHDFHLTVRRPSGKPLSEVRGQFNVKAEAGTWLGSARMNFELSGLPLAEYGRFMFALEVDGKPFAEHPLSVVRGVTPPKK